MKTKTAKILIGQNNDGRYFYRHPRRETFVYFRRSECGAVKAQIFNELQWGQKATLNWVSDQPTPLQNADGISGGYLL